MSVPPEAAIILPGEKKARLVYSIPEVARLLGVCRNTVYSHMKNGGLPAIKIGGATRVLAEDLQKYLASRPKLYETAP